MTIITVRDGVLAVDSRVSTAGGAVVGSVRKWAYVDDACGGGIVAAAGELGPADTLLKDYALNGRATCEGISAVHLKANGEVLVTDGKNWFTFDSEFYAAGSRESQALAAMHAGASAKRAAQIVCSMFPSECGGPVHVFHVVKKDEGA